MITGANSGIGKATAPGLARLGATVVMVAVTRPATQAMNAFNELAMGKTADTAPWGSVVVLLLSGLLAFGLAIYLFR